MVKYKALQNFRAFKENTSYKKGDEFEMTVARATELQANVDVSHPDAGLVMERLDTKTKGDELNEKE